MESTRYEIVTSVGYQRSLKFQPRLEDLKIIKKEVLL